MMRDAWVEPRDVDLALAAGGSAQRGTPTIVQRDMASAPGAPVRAAAEASLRRIQDGEFALRAAFEEGSM